MMEVRTHVKNRLLIGCQLAVTAAAVGWLAVQPPLQARNGGADLIVRQDILEQQWVVRDENLPASYCSVIEGEVQPGVHRLIRFTVMTPNIGTEDITVGDPNEHFAAGDGLFEFATCHQHYHFRHYAQYQLIDPATGHVWRAAKRGFCMLDTDPNPAYYGMPPRAGKYRSCGAIGIAGNQGVTAGWADTYRFFLGGQYFVLDGGDGQPPVPPGNYVIRITVNPPFVPQGGEPCPYQDSNGFCHQLPESNYANNSTQVDVSIPGHPGRNGSGPLAGTAPQAESNDCHSGNK
jgi:hypothetical protein